MNKLANIIYSILKWIKQIFIRDDWPRWANIFKALVLLSFLSVYMYHHIMLKPKAELILQDLDNEFKNINAYEGLNLIKQHSNAGIRKAYANRDYRTTEDSNLILGHYKSELERTGWELSCSFHKNAKEMNCYIKGDYVAIIRHELIEKQYWGNYKDPRYSLDVSLLWGLGECSGYCD